MFESVYVRSFLLQWPFCLNSELGIYLLQSRQKLWDEHLPLIGFAKKTNIKNPIVLHINTVIFEDENRQNQHRKKVNCPLLICQMNRLAE